MERASFKFNRALNDIELILREKGYKLDKDIIPHLGMELMKAEQYAERTKVLERELTELTNMLNYPLQPLINNIGHIGDAIEELSESVAFLKGSDAND